MPSSSSSASEPSAADGAGGGRPARPPRGGPRRQVPPLQSCLLVDREVVARGHRRDDRPHALVPQPLDLRPAAVGTVAATAAARPLEGAELAGPCPPDSLGCLHRTPVRASAEEFAP